jgi:hypothetical protein
MLRFNLADSTNANPTSFDSICLNNADAASFDSICLTFTAHKAESGGAAAPNATFAVNKANKDNAASFNFMQSAPWRMNPTLAANKATGTKESANKAKNDNAASFNFIASGPWRMNPTFAANKANGTNEANLASLNFIPFAPQPMNPTFTVNNINANGTNDINADPTNNINADWTNNIEANDLSFDFIALAPGPMNPTFASIDANGTNAAKAASFNAFPPTLASDVANLNTASFDLIWPAVNNLTFWQNHQSKVKQGKRKKRTFTKCAFRLRLSYGKPLKRMMCAAPSNRHHCEVMMKCMQW